jgi:hypothetical protein
MIENMLYGYDVLISAIHLTASTLALRAPHITFDKMELFSLPLGGDDARLGSIELLGKKSTELTLDLFGSAVTIRQSTGTGEKESIEAQLPDLDLCVMNPPFTRSVGGNLLFGGLPEAERNQMQKKLQKLIKKLDVKANVTAGLGSVFVAVADQHIKKGGRIALVLPKALLSGVAWEKTRQLLDERYDLEYIVASHDPERWNFSESTSLSEVLVVARRKANNSNNSTTRIIGLNLLRNPLTAFESLAIANSLLKGNPPNIEDSQGALEISLNSTKVAEAVRVRRDTLKSINTWMLPCSFAQNDLIRVAYHLFNGEVWLPGYGGVGELPLCHLNELGSLGPDVRDIHDGFNISKTPSAYPAFWNHDAESVTTIAQIPNQFLSPLTQAKENRHLRKVEDLWPKAGTVLIAERLRLNSQKLVSISLPNPVLSNSWWPFSFSDSRDKGQCQKVFGLWLNSTFGITLLLLLREETEGAWVKFKKPALGSMPVIDLRTLKTSRLKALSNAFDRLSNETLRPFPEMYDDNTRAEIDKAIEKAFDLPDLSVLRQLLAREPIVCLRRL